MTTTADQHTSGGALKPYSRSNTGCWTCRVRRKKCDEKQDVCSLCFSLDLQCAGYGPKPQWMDGGAQEKQMAQEIKSCVDKKRKRGRYKVDDPRRSSNTRVQREPTSTPFFPDHPSRIYETRTVCSTLDRSANRRSRRRRYWRP